VFALNSKLTPTETPFELITNLNAYTPLQLKHMGFDISTSFVQGDTLLRRAIKSWDVVQVKEILEAGANVNCSYLVLPLAIAVSIPI
jgi:hypothetical protein